MRVAQGEIINTPNRPDMYVIQSKPVQKTDRVGGFGSTGQCPQLEMADAMDELVKQAQDNDMGY